MLFCLGLEKMMEIIPAATSPKPAKRLRKKPGSGGLPAKRLVIMKAGTRLLRAVVSAAPPESHPSRALFPSRPVGERTNLRTVKRIKTVAALNNKSMRNTRAACLEAGFERILLHM